MRQAKFNPLLKKEGDKSCGVKVVIFDFLKFDFFPSALTHRKNLRPGLKSRRLNAL